MIVRMVVMLMVMVDCGDCAVVMLVRAIVM